MSRFSRLGFFKRPQVFIPVLIILIIVAVVGLAFHNLNAPAVGQISQTPPSKAEAVDPYAHPARYTGKYISFTYPAHYKVVPTQISGSYLEVAGFYATDQTSKQISVGVLKESINEDSSISFRRQRPDVYHESPRTGSGIVIFTKSSDGSERTAFVPHGDKVATFSITAPPGWDLAEDLQTMLSSLAWKQ